jgi:hypothetical protein
MVIKQIRDNTWIIKTHVNGKETEIEVTLPRIIDQVGLTLDLI